MRRIIYQFKCPDCNFKLDAFKYINKYVICRKCGSHLVYVKPKKVRRI